MRSRLKSNIKKQSIHLVLIIAAIIIILLTFGTQLLIGFSIAIATLRGADKVEIYKQDIAYVAAPILDPIPSASRNSEIKITGSTNNPDSTVTLYQNGQDVKKTKTLKNGNFVFENIKLETRNNEFKAKVIVDRDNQSDFSESINIKFLNKNPELTINTPQDGQKFSKDQSPLKISGKTDPGNKVSINDFFAIINEDGEFYYMYNLKDGGNNLKIISTDEAGNSTSKELNITVE